MHHLQHSSQTHVQLRKDDTHRCLRLASQTGQGSSEGTRPLLRPMCLRLSSPLGSVRMAGGRPFLCLKLLFLTSEYSSYYTLAKVGNLTYRIAIDTGSSDLWLVDSTCSTSTCKSTPRFPLAYYSSTYSSINDNQTYFDLSFADETSASAVRFFLVVCCW